MWRVRTLVGFRLLFFFVVVGMFVIPVMLVLTKDKGKGWKGWGCSKQELAIVDLQKEKGSEKLKRRHTRFSFYAVPLGFPLASFFAFWSSLAFFFCSSFLLSFLRFRLWTSSSVLAMGLKKPSSRACVAVLRFFVKRVAALRTRSSLKPFSVTKNVTRPSTSGASHLKSQSG